MNTESGKNIVHSACVYYESISVCLIQRHMIANEY